MLDCGELQLITRAKCEKIQFKSEFTQSSVTYSNLNSRSSVEEVKSLFSNHTIIRRKQVKEFNL